MAILIKRAYDPPAGGDGFRVLIDRVWPRGVTKDALKLDEWLKDLAPSTELRKWFGHDPEKWTEFKTRYFRELDAHAEHVKSLKHRAAQGTVTLVFGARDTQHNNAVALREYLTHR
jgi:uncharacterized protein YeaO (DUF488 family)